MKKISVMFYSVLMLLLLFANAAYAQSYVWVNNSRNSYPGRPIDNKCVNDYCNTGKAYDFPYAAYPPMNNYYDQYYYGWDGRRYDRPIEKGWHYDNIGKSYYKGDGSFYKNGWYWIDGKRYKFDGNGYVYRNQWIKDNYGGSWYFVDTDGASVVGWRQIDNIWYYFYPELTNLYGVMAKDTMIFINDGVFGVGYFAFSKDGAIITNSWYGGHYYGSNGVRID